MHMGWGMNPCRILHGDIQKRQQSFPRVLPTSHLLPLHHCCLSGGWRKQLGRVDVGSGGHTTHKQDPRHPACDKIARDNIAHDKTLAAAPLDIEAYEAVLLPRVTIEASPMMV
jgi:hypothetical protein